MHVDSRCGCWVWLMGGALNENIMISGQCMFKA